MTSIEGWWFNLVPYWLHTHNLGQNDATWAQILCWTYTLLERLFQRSSQSGCKRNQPPSQFKCSTEYISRPVQMGVDRGLHYEPCFICIHRRRGGRPTAIYFLPASERGEAKLTHQASLRCSSLVRNNVWRRSAWYTVALKRKHLFKMTLRGLQMRRSNLFFTFWHPT